MNCMDCKAVIPSEQREDVDSDEITPCGARRGEIYHDVGSLYHCVLCGCEFRFIATRPKGAQLRKIVDGHVTDRRFGLGDDEQEDDGVPRVRRHHR